jgi:hypothetical protein
MLQESCFSHVGNDLSTSQRAKQIETLYFNDNIDRFTTRASTTTSNTIINTPIFLHHYQKWIQAMSDNWPRVKALSSRDMHTTAVKLSNANMTPLYACTLPVHAFASAVDISIEEAAHILLILKWWKERTVSAAAAGSYGHPPLLPSANFSSTFESDDNFRFTEPHGVCGSFVESSVASAGAVAVLQSTHQMHAAVSFINALLLSAATTGGVIGGYGPVNILRDDASSQAQFALLTAAAFLRLIALVHSVVVMIAISSASSSDYTACCLLALPEWFRFMDSRLTILAFLLNLARGIVELSSSTTLPASTTTSSPPLWYPIAYGCVVGVTIFLCLFLVVYFNVRVSTSYRVPTKQWMRWFPLGYSATTRNVAALLNANGTFRRRQQALVWRQAVTKVAARMSFHQTAGPPPPFLFEQPL